MARADINYDYEDFGMDSADLAAKYDKEHPSFPRTAHATYAAMPTRDVKLDYWDWVVRCIKHDEDTLPDMSIKPAPEAFQAQLTEQEVEDVETIHVETIDQFAGYIAHWHASRLAILRQFMQVPDGETATFKLNGVEETVVLTGEAHKAFRAAMLTAIIQFDSLPFAVTVTDANGTPVTDMPAVSDMGNYDDASAPKH